MKKYEKYLYLQNKNYNMKITIDTKEDSPEEIKNIIKMLSSLIEEKVLTNKQNIFEDSSPEITPQKNVFGNIFNNAETKSEAETKTTEETKIEKSEEKDDDEMPSISEYF